MKIKNKGKTTFLKRKSHLGVMAHAFNASTRGAEVSDCEFEVKLIQNEVQKSQEKFCLEESKQKEKLMTQVGLAR